MLSENDRLKLLETYILFSSVKVKLVRNIPDLELGLISVRSRKAGEVITVPLWLGEFLIDKGLAVITDDMIKKISRNVWREYAQPRGESLAQVDKDFYSVAKLYLYFLRKSGGMGLRPLAKEEDIIKVLNKRVAIIMKLATLDFDTHVVDRLTFEEKVLLNYLRSVYREWKNIMGI